MKTCLTAVTLGPLGDLKSPWIVSERVSALRASMMLLTFGAPISSCRGWYGSYVTESLRPGTLNSERSFPPKILVMGDPSLSMERETEALCFGPTSCQSKSSLVTENEEPVGEAGPLVGVAIADGLFDELFLMTRTHSS